MLEIDVTDVRHITTDPLYQWDIDQVIKIAGASDAIQLHFCNKKSDRAIVVESIYENDLVTVSIPDILLEEPYDITAYGYSGGKTLFEVHIPIVKRTQPDEMAE